MRSQIRWHLDSNVASPAIGAILFLIRWTVTWQLIFLAFQEFLPGRFMFETGLVFASLIATGFVVVAHWTYGLGLAVTFQFLRKRQRRRLVALEESAG